MTRPDNSLDAVLQAWACSSGEEREHALSEMALQFAYEVQRAPTTGQICMRSPAISAVALLSAAFDALAKIAAITQEDEEADQSNPLLPTLREAISAFKSALDLYAPSYAPSPEPARTLTQGSKSGKGGRQS